MVPQDAASAPGRPPQPLEALTQRLGEVLLLEDVQEEDRLHGEGTLGHVDGVEVPRQLRVERQLGIEGGKSPLVGRVEPEQPFAGFLVKLESSSEASEWRGLERMHQAGVFVPAAVLVRSQEQKYMLMADLGQDLERGVSGGSITNLFETLDDDACWKAARQLAVMHLVDISIGNNNRLPLKSEHDPRMGCQNVFMFGRRTIVGQNTEYELRDIEREAAFERARREYLEMSRDAYGRAYATWMIERVAGGFGSQQGPKQASYFLDQKQKEAMIDGFQQGLLALHSHFPVFRLQRDAMHRLSALRVVCLRYERHPVRDSAFDAYKFATELVDRREASEEAVRSVVRQTLDLIRFQRDCPQPVSW